MAPDSLAAPDPFRDAVHRGSSDRGGAATPRLRRSLSDGYRESAEHAGPAWRAFRRRGGWRAAARRLRRRRRRECAARADRSEHHETGWDARYHHGSGRDIGADDTGSDGGPNDNESGGGRRDDD